MKERPLADGLQLRVADRPRRVLATPADVVVSSRQLRPAEHRLKCDNVQPVRGISGGRSRAKAVGRHIRGVKTISQRRSPLHPPVDAGLGNLELAVLFEIPLDDQLGAWVRVEGDLPSGGGGLGRPHPGASRFDAEVVVVVDLLPGSLFTRPAEATVLTLLAGLKPGDNNHPTAIVEPLLAHVADLPSAHPQPAGGEDDKPGFEVLVVLHLVGRFDQQLKLAVREGILFAVMNSTTRRAASTMLAGWVRTHACVVQAQSGAPTPGQSVSGEPRSNDPTATSGKTNIPGVKV